MEYFYFLGADSLILQLFMKCLFRILFIAFLWVQAPCDAQIKNIQICQNCASEDLSMVIQPNNPNLLLCAANAGFYFSSDTGHTWVLQKLSCEKRKKYAQPFALWYEQHSYFSYVKGKDTNMISVHPAQISPTGHDCFAVKRTPGKVINGLKIFADKKTKSLGAVWSQRDSSQNKIKTDSSFIFYSFCYLPGSGWTNPERISAFNGDSSRGESALMGLDACLGLNSEVYVAWAGSKGLVFRNLADQKSKTEKTVAPFVNGRQYVVGEKNVSNGLPTIACDQSNGPFRGRVYICWSDEKHGKHDKNVFIIYSDDQGDNWTEPILVTYNPNHKEQFMPSMTIDQRDGTLYILYYDQQNYLAGSAADLYLAQSKNGGLKFEYYKINEQPIQAHRQLSFGKSVGLSAVNGIVSPLWMQADSKKKINLFTALIDEPALLNYAKSRTAELGIKKTFHYSEKIKIDFTLKKATRFSAVLTKPLEAGFEKIILKNKKLKPGQHSFVINSKKLGLRKDNYTLILYYGNTNTHAWILQE